MRRLTSLQRREKGKTKVFQIFLFYKEFCPQEKKLLVISQVVGVCRRPDLFLLRWKYWVLSVQLLERLISKHIHAGSKYGKCTYDGSNAWCNATQMLTFMHLLAPSIAVYVVPPLWKLEQKKNTSNLIWSIGTLWLGDVKDDLGFPLFPVDMLPRDKEELFAKNMEN